MSTSLWTVGVVLTIFLGILSLETSISSSVDSLAIKATTSAVSNFVPVVGKFFTDSFETVVGASKIIGNIGGVLGIIAIFVIAVMPIIKIVCISVVYNIFSALLEPICKDSKILNVLSNFASIYKVMIGIMTGVSIMFIISMGIIVNISTTTLT